MDLRTPEEERRSLVFGPKFLMFSVVVIVITFLAGMYSGEFEKYNDGMPNDTHQAVDTIKTEQ